MGTSNIFKLSSIDKNNDIFIYSEIFMEIMALIARIEHKSVIDVLINNKYDTELVKISKIPELEEKVSMISLTSEIDLYNEYLLTKEEIDNMDNDQVYETLIRYKHNRLSLLRIFMLLDKANKLNSPKYIINKLSLLYIFKDVLNLPEMEQIKYGLRYIHFENYKLDMRLIFPSEVIYYFDLLGIKSLKEMKNNSIDLLNILFLEQRIQMKNILADLSRPIEEIYYKRISELEVFLSRKESYLDIITKRNGVYDEFLTLEELGQVYSLTRERVRQIELKINKIIKEMFCHLSTYADAFLSTFYEGKTIITKEEVVEKFNLKVYGYTKLLLTIYDLNFRYSKEYEVIYLDGCLKSEVQNKLKDFIIVYTQEKYDTMSVFEKRIIDKHYSLRESNVYLKSGMVMSDIYSYVVDTLFPEGIVLNDESMKKFNEMLNTSYGIPPINAHALQSILLRLDYVSIDKGKFLNAKDAPKMDEEFTKKVSAFIVSKEAVYYTSIYEMFKEDFNSIGVYNRFYAKGIIDRGLPKSFIRKRDYVSSGQKCKTSSNAICKFVRNSTGVVLLEDLKREFPGVEENVFLTNLSQADDILHYYFGKSFVLLDNLNIDDSLMEIIENEIDYSLSFMNAKVVTSYNLYDTLIEKHGEEMKKYPLINSQFILFSIVSVLLKDKYFFKRPYIYTEGKDITSELLISNYIRSLDKFSLSTVQKYINQMKMRGLDNYLALMIDNSDSFVQISADTCVKKELLNLSEEDLDGIKKVIDKIIKKESMFVSRTFDKYDRLPVLKYPWNKHLLAGIVRSYFYEIYSIEYTTGYYVSTGYIFKRR